jgi:hypothetical protein
MEYTLYKPNKKGTGSAVKFNIHKSGKFAFMKIARQNAPMGSSTMFGWDDESAINVKLGTNDLGSMYAVLRGIVPTIKLFHQTDRDNKIIEIKDVPDRGGYSLSVSHKIGGGESNSMFLGIKYEEIAFLIRFVTNAIDSVLINNVWTGETYDSRRD